MSATDRAALERKVALVRLGGVVYIVVQAILTQPAGLLAAFAAAIGATAVAVAVLVAARRAPERLGRTPVLAAILVADWAVVTVVTWSWASPGDNTWLAFVLVVISGAIRWQMRGAIAAFLLFSASTLPLNLLRPGWTHLDFAVSSITFQLGFVGLLTALSGLQARSEERARGELRRSLGMVDARVGELAVLQDAARELAASLDIETVLSSSMRLAADALSMNGTERPRVCIFFRAGARPGEAQRLADEQSGSEALLDASALLLSRPGGPATLDAPRARLWSATDLRTEAARRDAAQTGCDHGVVAPLLAGRRHIAVLAIGFSSSRTVDPTELGIVEGLAHLIALAISNAESFNLVAEAAATDHLTSLANRREFDRRLAATSDDRFAVLAIDVDGLKQVNDSLGHEAGDKVLRSVAGILAGTVRTADLVARVGGDEFAALLPGVDQAGAQEIASRLVLAARSAAVPAGLGRISVGVAAAERGESGHHTWRRADQALYQAKARGRDRVTVFDSGDQASAPSVTAWEDRLPLLLERRAVSAVYQPVVRLDDLGIIGFEALARPTGSLLTTAVDGLFAAAWRTGVDRDLDWLCRRAAFSGAAALPDAVDLFVNVGLGALLSPLHDVDQMLLLASCSMLAPARIVLEISEREAVTDIGLFREVLAAYRAKGFRFAIDDAGEGHSTLEVMAAACPEFVKVARSLTATIAEPGPRAAVHALVAFAEVVGAEVIAEGIETETELTLTRAAGVRLGQGFGVGLARHPDDLGRPTASALARAEATPV